MQPMKPQRERRRAPWALRAVALALLTTLPTLLGAWSVAPSAAAAPPTPNFGPIIDKYALYDGQDTCDPTAKPGVVDFRDMLLAAYPGSRNGGIGRDCSLGSTSEHKEGRALDWGVNVNVPAEKAMADDALNWLLKTDEHGNTHANARRLGIMYVIWNARIWRAYDADGGWRAYTGSNPHTDHVHFSFSWAGARRETTWWHPEQTGAMTQPTPNPTPAPTWSGWNQLGGVITSDPDAASWGTDRIDVVARGTHMALYHKTYQNGAWGGWANLSYPCTVLDGCGLTSSPAIASWGPGRLDVFARGPDKNIWHRGYGSSVGWSAWQSLGAPPGYFDPTSDVQSIDGSNSGPDAASWAAGRIDLVVVAADGAAWHKAYSSTTGWQGWVSLGGQLTSDPTIVERGVNRLEVFGRGRDNAMWQKTYGATGWTGWSNRAGALTSAPDASAWDTTQVDVFVRGTDHALHYRRWTSASGFGGWASLGGVMQGGPGATSWGTGRIDVFVRGTDNGLYHKYYQ